MKKFFAVFGLSAMLMVNGVVVTSIASADVLSMKKSVAKCDQGVLTTYNAYVSARKAVFAAYEAELSRAKEMYEITVKTGTRSQRKDARGVYLAAKATALSNRNLALTQLGAPPRLPVGCKAEKS